MNTTRDKVLKTDTKSMDFVKTYRLCLHVATGPPCGGATTRVTFYITLVTLDATRLSQLGCSTQSARCSLQFLFCSSKTLTKAFSSSDTKFSSQRNRRRVGNPRVLPGVFVVNSAHAAGRGQGWRRSFGLNGFERVCYVPGIDWTGLLKLLNKIETRWIMSM